MRTNLFPAILIAGPPHSGKSVLAYLLSQRLRKQEVAHYLLRAVPDGEGDWYLEGDPSVVRALRVKHKTGYSRAFVQHMRSIIEGRLLPLLVDVGGRPQGVQLEILKACTHSILLFRTPSERQDWRDLLAGTDLLPVAELQSSLDSAELVYQDKPVLQAVITGLERDISTRKAGTTFEALLERVAGICHYEAAFLEREHLRHAPFHPLLERELATKINPHREVPLIWEASHLSRLKGSFQAGQPIAVYGRGPVWLGAWLAIQALPAPVAIFDVRYGWVIVPEVEITPHPQLQYRFIPYNLFDEGTWIEIVIPGGILERNDIRLPPIPGAGGAVLSGKLPRWAFAALARKLSKERPWVGIYVPALGGAIVVHSVSPSVAVGDFLIQPMGTEQQDANIIA